MGWTGGYVSDIEYTTGFYPEQGPTMLNFVAVLNGYAPVPDDRHFTYFELGFGRGMTVNLLAAANPNGRFYAADFNPAHVAGAAGLAEGAELANLTLLERSFEELAAGAEPLPQFDYITLHGIYTWVDAANRGHIVDFIGRYLKPGGLVYVSYNALPGWAASMPLQRLLVEYGDAYPNRSDVQVTHAAQFVQKLMDAKVGYFTSGGTALAGRLEGLGKHNRNYLVHEYMHKHWQPMYHADVARDLAEAKLEFAGSADLSLRYPRMYLTDEKMALLATFTDSAMQETLKDYCLNTSFRKDVFVRGARRLAPTLRQAMLQQYGLVLSIPREQAQLKFKLAHGEASTRAELAVPILDEIARGPRTLAQLMALPPLRGCTVDDVAQLAALFIQSRQAELYHTGKDDAAAPVARMNLRIAGEVRHGDEYPALASALTGSAVQVPYLSRMVYWLLAGQGMAADRETLARAAWAIMRSQGRQIVRDGVVLADENESLAELSRTIGAVLEQQVPVWRRIGVLPEAGVQEK